MTHKQSHQTLVLSKRDIQKIVFHYDLDTIMDTLIDQLEEALATFNDQETDIPVRSGFSYRNPYQGLIEWMPLHDKKRDSIVNKIVGYHPANPDKFDLPTIISTISLYSAKTGQLLGLMDGVLLTALRTGAMSAIASKYLAQDKAGTLGLIGCGAQAVTQLHAISREFDLEKVMYYDIDPSAMQSFSDRLQHLDLSIQMQSAPIEEIVGESDILCTITSIDVGAGPLFKDNLPRKNHLHINAVGSDFPGKTELAKELLHNGFVCPDYLDQALIEGECQQLEENRIGPELAQIVKDPNAFEKYKNKVSVFDSTGFALQDQVAMHMFLNLAEELGLGEKIVIESISQDAKDPYDFVKKTTLVNV
ncbi:MAG: ornithine cyclodeaminase family protein [Saprospiraceae bacterium]|nr:ornithine cyclodeaminase family protein [Saprospiraceae bacterium]